MSDAWTIVPLLSLCLSLCLPATGSAEDGYELWLRYDRPDLAAEVLPQGTVQMIAVLEPDSATMRAAIDELRRGLDGLLGVTTQVTTRTSQLENGALVLLGPETLPPLGEIDLELEGLGSDGFIVRGITIGDDALTVIAANTDIGRLYGTFALLRHLQTGRTLRDVDIISSPKVALRLLNHWDNLDGSIERGFAGRSLWDWSALPVDIDPRYRDYARANASIGINGTVLNNVNADAEILTPEYIVKVAALADAFRPYGIRVYLSARFSAPIEIGGLETADPIEPAVRRWWQDKAAEVYRSIPDFGGFLVKANSEGQPGPQDYGRSHADGANVLAEAVAPYGGVVMWRAFVYQSENTEDRARQAYSEFVPLDGRFADNVIVQVKNGPIDFQPREPFHPVFGAMPQTSLGLELQITKEYLGMASHLAYVGPLWQEVLEADTYARGSGSTVARVVDGSLHGHALTAIAGVANTGTDRDWSGSPFNQANWYAFGRLAWDPSLAADAIADEWLRMTFSHDPEFVSAAKDIMRLSREAVVNYMTPLGLAHLMATGHHYGPGPWVDDLSRPEWNPAYYHRADADGIGFDRTAGGSDALSQYFEPVASRFADLETVGDAYLLWFHHLPWDYEMDSGRTLWDELVRRYDLGVAQVRSLQTSWARLEAFVDGERFVKTTELLGIQHEEAQWWRDASIAYFQSVSGLPLPPGVEPPPRPVEYYRSLDRPPPR